jgi:hypothetical protein
VAVKAPLWTLDDALTLVRALQPFTRQFGYHLTLGGGVLNVGSSTKDLDLFFLPLDNGGVNRPDDLLSWLKLTFSSEAKNIGGLHYGNDNFNEMKQEMRYDGKRVDVFIGRIA